MKLKYIFSAVLLAATATSCVDLGYTEVTTRDEQWVYDSPLYGVQQLMTSVYAYVPNGFTRNYEGGSGATLAAATDEADCALSNSSVHRFYNGGWSAVNPLDYTWTNSYKAIAEANNLLEKLDKIDISGYANNTDYEAMKAKFSLFEYEARFLRCYFYYELVRAYDNVPFTLKTLSAAEANTIAQTDGVKILDWISQELDDIAPELPITYSTELNPDIGRATRPMCLALKARVKLLKASPLFNPENNKQLWLDAAQASYDLLSRAAAWGITLGNYANIWGPQNGDGTEVIMASKRGRLNSWEQYNYPIGVENGQGGMCPTQSLVDAYEYTDGTGETFGDRHGAGSVDISQTDPYDGLDPRFALTVVKNGDYWPNYNLSPIETFNGGKNAAPLHNATTTGYYLKKYCDPNVNISTNDATTTPHAWIIMRLGEFYLDYAEAMYEYYGDAEAKGNFTLSANDAINALLNREDVKMPNWSGNPANWLSRYKRERFVEMAFEDQRFWDVRRWKDGQQLASIQVANLRKNASGDVILTRATVNRSWSDKYYFFPIPYDEINKNHNLVQNPGW